MEQQGTCINVRLVASKQDGPYTVYVFEDLSTNEFVMCTRCPNWCGQAPELLQEGFVTYKSVVAGQDTYMDRVTGRFLAYQYTATYFLDFVPLTHVLKDGYVTDLSTLTIV